MPIFPSNSGTSSSFSYSFQITLDQHESLPHCLTQLNHFQMVCWPFQICSSGYMVGRPTAFFWYNSTTGLLIYFFFVANSNISHNKYCEDGSVCVCNGNKQQNSYSNCLTWKILLLQNRVFVPISQLLRQLQFIHFIFNSEARNNIRMDLNNY